jgi:hypothetical protein
LGYKIVLINGNPEQTWDQETTIYSDMVLSVVVEQGAFFQDPAFGLAALPKSISDATVPLIRQRFEQAWKWLLDTGKAKSIAVTATPDKDNKNRVNISAEAVQANDLVIPFSLFVEVV